MRKPAFRKCKDNGADQLGSNLAADQHLCLSYIASTIPLLPKPEISSLQPSSMVVQPDLCRSWQKTKQNRLSHDGAHFMLIEE